jgi:hypothetical protein
MRLATSVVGTKRTSSDVRFESVFRCKADYMCGASISPFDPHRKSALVQQRPDML